MEIETNEQGEFTTKQMSPVVVHVSMKALPGREEEVKAEVQAAFTRIRRDVDSCVYIVGHQDVSDPAKFMLFEEWRDKAEFEEFVSEATMSDYLARLDTMLVERHLTLWYPFDA